MLTINYNDLYQITLTREQANAIGLNMDQIIECDNYARATINYDTDWLPTSYKAMCINIEYTGAKQTTGLTFHGYQTMFEVKQSNGILEGKVLVKGKAVECLNSRHLITVEGLQIYIDTILLYPE